MSRDAIRRFFTRPSTLVVDDDEGIRVALRRLLEEAGHRVVVAASGAEALAAAEAQPEELALCICDYKMPGMSGLETLAALRARDAGLLLVLLTGYATLDAAIAATNLRIDAFLTKPYRVAELRSKVAELLEEKRQVLAERLLGDVALLRGVPRPVLANLYASLEKVTFARGAVIQERGSPAEHLYIVREGSVRLEVQEPSGRARAVAHLGPGEHFGEGELATGAPVALRAIAAQDCELEALSRGAFDQLRAQVPALAESVARAVTERLHDVAGRAKRASLLVVCRAPADWPRAPLELARAFAAVGADAAVLVLAQTAQREGSRGDGSLAVDREEGIARYAVSVQALADAEALRRAVAKVRREHRVVVLALPESPSPELARLAREAQTEITFAPASIPSWVRARIESRADGLVPEGRSALAASELRAQGPGLRRVARRLLGTSLGLALGAGAVRGLAHYGVLRAFDRAGLEVDAIAGSSIGACIGGIVAAGHSLDTTERVLRGFTLDLISAPFRRPSWERARDLVRELGAGRTFEDAAIPFLCNATDLNAGAEVVFESGPIESAVIASMCLPGLFPPFTLDGLVLADGGLVNGLPANHLAERGLDLVAAVDVFDHGRWSLRGDGQPGVRRFINSVMPDVAQKLGSLPIMFRSIMLMARHLMEARFHACDLTIRPELPGSQLSAILFDPETYPAIFEAGERAGEIAARDLLARRAELTRRWAPTAALSGA